MARRKSTDDEEREFVRLREKQLAKGRKSLYLDIYEGNGKRRYEFLNLYLEPETNRVVAKRNTEVRLAAQKILEARAGEVKAEKKLEAPSRRTPLLDYTEAVRDKHDRGNTHEGYNSLITHLRAYISKYYPTVRPEKYKLVNVGVDFIAGFVRYLREDVTGRVGHRHLTPGSVRTYYLRLVAVISDARKAGIITGAPVEAYRATYEHEKPKKPEDCRPYLIEEEIKQLARTPCRVDTVRRMFLLSCFTGLRLSDVEALTWGDLTTGTDGKLRAEISMQKTGSTIQVTINRTARQQLPERGEKTDEDRVFEAPGRSWIQKVVKEWVKAAGINKYITFHSARHTFATLSLTRGTDIYTVSKLLGHKSVEVTQIYAEVIGKKKEEGYEATEMDLD